MQKHKPRYTQKQTTKHAPTNDTCSRKYTHQHPNHGQQPMALTQKTTKIPPSCMHPNHILKTHRLENTTNKLNMPASCTQCQTQQYQLHTPPCPHMHANMIIKPTSCFKFETKKNKKTLAHTFTNRHLPQTTPCLQPPHILYPCTSYNTLIQHMTPRQHQTYLPCYKHTTTSGCISNYEPITLHHDLAEPTHLPQNKKTIIQRRRIKNVVVLPTEALDQFWTLPYRRKKIATQSYKSKGIPLSHHIAPGQNWPPPLQHKQTTTHRQVETQCKPLSSRNGLPIKPNSHVPHWKLTMRGGP